MALDNIFSIISCAIGIGALSISIIAIVLANKREKDRKLKDIIIEELADLQNGFLNYLTPLFNCEAKYSCQQTISWFKFTVCKVEAINAYILDTLKVDKKDIEVINTEIQNLRTFITDAVSFGKAYKEPAYLLSKDEIIKLGKYYAKTYKAFLSNIAKVNNSDRKKCK